MTADSPGTRIGGTAAGARNVVGGNRIGVYAAGPGTLVEGNLVGLAPDGRTVLGNEQGIALEGAAAGMRVGANVVSGNSVLGVVLKNTAGAVVAANVIGRTADGAESRPNGFFGGVMLIDSSGGVVGGDAPGDANLIDGGVNPSIRAEGAGQLGTQLLGNLLRGTSHSLGIDLVPLAVTANDPGDADTGPNGLQNAPVVTRARRTAVTGTIGTKPSTAARIQVFSASADGRETYALLGDASRDDRRRGRGRVLHPGHRDRGSLRGRDRDDERRHLGAVGSGARARPALRPQAREVPRRRHEAPRADPQQHRLPTSACGSRPRTPGSRCGRPGR